MLNITKKINKELKIKILIFIAFFVLSIYLTLTHQPWRDEAQAWLIARDSNGLSGLFQLMGYEGTPGLWHLILFPFARLGFPFQTIFVIHFLLNLFAIWLLVFKSPFKPYQIALICFGYYSLIEYNIIARSYILSLIGLELVIIFYLSKKSIHRLKLMALGFFILAWSNILGAIIAMVLFAFYFFFKRSELHKKQRIYYLIFFFIVFLFLFIQLIPPSDLASHVGFNLHISFTAAKNLLMSFSNSFISNIFTFAPQTILTSSVKVWLYPLIFFLIALLCSLSLIKKPKYFLLFAIMAFAELALFQIKEIGITSYRHCGIIYISYLGVLWLSYNEKESKNKIFKFIPRWLTAISFTILISIGVVSSLLNIIRLEKHPFSNATYAFQFLKSNGYTDNDYFIGGFDCPPMQVITANMPSYFKMYVSDYGDYQTYIKWDLQYALGTKKSDSEKITSYLKEFYNTPYKKGVLIVDKYSNDDSLIRSKGFGKIAQIYGSILSDEDFDIWLIAK